MKISKLALIALLGGALMAFGCSEDDEGGGGTAGTGGTGGAGCELACCPSTGACSNGEIDEIITCTTCNLATPPTQDDACTGSESLVNPTSCTPTGNTVRHQLTVMQIAGDCNVGYNLDSCDGTSCKNGELAPGEGENAVDNALAGLGPTLVNVGGNLGGVNQALYNAICGVADDPEQGICEGGANDGDACVCPFTCNGGANDGDACTVAADCPKTCDGGANDGDACTAAADCPKTCNGGANDGDACTAAADCPDGTCEGACTGACEQTDCDAGCPKTCNGGANNGDACTVAADCPKTCNGGANDGDTCTVAADCPDGTCEGTCEGTCNLGNADCLVEATPLDIELVVDANVDANCANVTVSSGGATSDIILNLSEPATEGGPVCASGTIGTIPVVIAGETGTFGNAVIRATVSADGFTDGLLGATIDGETAVTIAEALLPGAGAVVVGVYDITTDLSGDNTADCDALSATFEIAGVALPPAQ